MGSHKNTMKTPPRGRVHASMVAREAQLRYMRARTFCGPPPAMEKTVSKLDFGLTMTLVGMGGTLLSLWVLTLVMKALRKFFPERPAAAEATKGGQA